jgi:hypothetical protein
MADPNDLERLSARDRAVRRRGAVRSLCRLRALRAPIDPAARAATVCGRLRRAARGAASSANSTMQPQWLWTTIGFYPHKGRNGDTSATREDPMAAFKAEYRTWLARPALHNNPSIPAGCCPGGDSAQKPQSHVANSLGLRGEWQACHETTVSRLLGFDSLWIAGAASRADLGDARKNG